MARGNITIKELAKELNLSTAAVSKALRDSHEISAATKKRVMAVAEKLNYIPNPYAGSLRHRKSKTIAVVLPEVADSFFSLAINGIESVAIEKGYHVLLYLTHESILREEAICKDLASGRVDGVLLSISSETDGIDHIRALFNRDMPIVFFDRICEEIETAKITTNDYESGYKAAEHLIECGCKRVAFFSISNSLQINNKRKQGCLQACRDHGVEDGFSHLLLSNRVSEINYKQIKAALLKPDRPDGIVASVEKFTTDIYLSCRELGLDIPADVKVVSFSNLASVSILDPSLTTITQPAFEMGQLASSILIKSIEQKSFTLKDENIVIPSTLAVRASTASRFKSI
ncbi:LacI family DNA-binding transcriptional regulator [Arachidicoccus terrestris]|uniref:LacI family DNA-binding transcriptional regulator n=1 Tax=Arachidicoccus terrestris TaxID=2875539 RepID=UPI001CC5CD4F|nr:LacI family DNA-binding transcriptional regulator [Arachidicoccus terrestris]UAY56015.1 LacI family transcriptional regulator [Arachidicoccus terrestris]